MQMPRVARTHASTRAYQALAQEGGVGASAGQGVHLLLKHLLREGQLAPAQEVLHERHCELA
jgi:hypothetical protein